MVYLCLSGSSRIKGRTFLQAKGFSSFNTINYLRGMIAASSVPNLATYQQGPTKKSKKYRIETDSETPYMSDVDYRYFRLFYWV